MALNGKKKTAPEKQPEEKSWDYEIEVTRAKEFKNAYAFDMKVNGVSIYGCWLRESKKGGNFISFPSYKGSDGKYYSHAWFQITDEVQADIEKQIEAAL